MINTRRPSSFKGFTLIELLVVIAIIAILAAILFPVFAQAKVAAKKASVINGQKQINLSIQLYIGDSDDVLPRQDGCAAGSSLNAALNNNPFNPTGVGCSTGPFFYRLNHFAWQKWVLPYMKSVDLFVHPGFGRQDFRTTSCPNGQWSTCGQLTGGYYLNLSLTGALNTYNASPTLPNQFRDSFRGGTITNLRSPAESMLMMEGPNPNIAFIPTYQGTTVSGSISSTNYPAAMREIWEMEFGIRQPDPSCTGVLSWPRKPFADGTTIGFADGHVKWYPVGKFLASTPTIAEYATPSAGVARCGFTGGTAHPSANTPIGITNNIQYPLWSRRLRMKYLVLAIVAMTMAAGCSGGDSAPTKPPLPSDGKPIPPSTEGTPENP